MKTPNQDAADRFDRRLYGLIGDAEYNASRSTGEIKELWEGVRKALSDARPSVRKMMHEKDVRQTA